LNVFFYEINFLGFCEDVMLDFENQAVPSISFPTRPRNRGFVEGLLLRCGPEPSYPPSRSWLFRPRQSASVWPSNALKDLSARRVPVVSPLPPLAIKGAVRALAHPVARLSRLVSAPSHLRLRGKRRDFLAPSSSLGSVA
jgi:hypothetical protein